MSAPIPNADANVAQRQVFISDLHLESPTDLRFQTFAAVLAAEADAGSTIFILGDLCEVWVGDDDTGEFAAALTQELSQAAARTSVNLMHGNRDFLFGEPFAAATGIQLLPDPFRLDDELLLSHGDMFCLDDEPYQEARAMLRSAQWQAGVLAQPLAARRQLAANMREQSQATNANKAANIMDVQAAAVSDELARQGCKQLLHGHTHRPGIHQAAEHTRFVLGDWEHCGWLGVREIGEGQVTPDTATPIGLVRIPLTGRYETVMLNLSPG